MLTGFRKMMCAALLCCTAVGFVGTASNRAAASDCPQGRGWTVHYTSMNPGSRAGSYSYHVGTYQAALQAVRGLGKQQSYGVKVWNVFITNDDE